ncbi:Transmembrane domain-containing protein [Orpheovirus IHUMI-LCC2]|uniref:Transmembrane domain-containing protein n=1 Tax=Orpheovirus IHUMI-LCC2 TaxID=2023057 RepID=A0A2I2L5L8_9VIRU|nr:Transmembrane domain-containing protein [Orpheovirus IHUMI-LCC2]SNW62842.1 Transmembrane domain-containing protein [Orpheovirus IHUMI-LCC2]
MKNKTIRFLYSIACNIFIWCYISNTFLDIINYENSILKGATMYGMSHSFKEKMYPTMTCGNKVECEELMKNLYKMNEVSHIVIDPNYLITSNINNDYISTMLIIIQSNTIFLLTFISLSICVISLLIRCIMYCIMRNVSNMAYGIAFHTEKFFQTIALAFITTYCFMQSIIFVVMSTFIFIFEYQIRYNGKNERYKEKIRI